MPRIIFLLALLLPTPSCFGQIVIQPLPKATSYTFFGGQPPRAVISPMTKEDDALFKKVYDKVLANNATLDAEGDTLWTQVADYRKVLIAAMIKIDPKVAPLVGEDSPIPIISTQTAKILQVQSEAMQANPKLQSEWDDLTKKLTAHQQEVDAAMVKLDPTVAPVLAKFSP